MARHYDDRVIALISDNAASLLRIARRHSLCHDDAQDAYQCTLEIYLARIDQVQDATAAEWLRTVCKHEAMRLRAARQRVLPAEEVDWDQRPADDLRDPDERAASAQRVAQVAEALRDCKADERTAMLLKADGSSYAEIGELTGWTYTKVNRSLAEGRRRFLSSYADIAAGDACASYVPVLSAIVDGEATPDDFTALRPHLRHCAGCRASLRAMYEAEPALGALMPAGALVLAAAPGVDAIHGVVARLYEAAVTGFGDRIVRTHALVEAVTSTKTAALLASTAAVAAGGVATVEHRPGPEPRAQAARAVVAQPPTSARRARPRVRHRPAHRATRAITRATPTPTPTPAARIAAARPAPAPAATAVSHPTSAAPSAAQAQTASTTAPATKAPPAAPTGEFGFEG